MHSSEARHVRRLVILGCCAALLSACAGRSATATADPAATWPARCEAAGALPDDIIGAAAAMHRQILAGRLMRLVTAAATPPMRCRVGLTEGSVLRIDYLASDRPVMTISHDPRIEYTEQTAQVRLDKGTSVLDALGEMEHLMLGTEGCRIDWQHPEHKPATVRGQAALIYRGDVCNCQARVTHDAQGTIVQLGFRSAC
ncbi:MAG: hypothetical protein RLY71_1450 [Pseudomonadota bacterium]|jgi:hypothetical protein